MDDYAHRIANALVHNAPDAAAMEITLSGPTLRFNTDATIALTGAEFDADIDGNPIEWWRSVRLHLAAKPSSPPDPRARWCCPPYPRSQGCRLPLRAGGPWRLRRALLPGQPRDLLAGQVRWPRRPYHPDWRCDPPQQATVGQGSAHSNRDWFSSTHPFRERRRPTASSPRRSSRFAAPPPPSSPPLPRTGRSALPTARTLPLTSSLRSPSKCCSIATTRFAVAFPTARGFLDSFRSTTTRTASVSASLAPSPSSPARMVARLGCTPPTSTTRSTPSARSTSRASSP